MRRISLLDMPFKSWCVVVVVVVVAVVVIDQKL